MNRRLMRIALLMSLLAVTSGAVVAGFELPLNGYGSRDDATTDTVRIYARFEEGKLERLRALSADCPVQSVRSARCHRLNGRASRGRASHITRLRCAGACCAAVMLACASMTAFALTQSVSPLIVDDLTRHGHDRSREKGTLARAHRVATG
jgi:hypothetical protein